MSDKGGGMPDSRVFAKNVERYDHWYDNHTDLFHAELAAIRILLPPFERGLEVGVGTGRFAKELGIGFGVDPEPEMLKMASDRGVDSLTGVAEHLPYKRDLFDFALMTTTICFLDDIDKAFSEIHRVLVDGGCFIVAFIDKNSRLGVEYQNKTDCDSPFYSKAQFRSPDEVIAKLAQAGFHFDESRQTLLPDDQVPFQILSGYGDGAFVTLKVSK